MKHLIHVLSLILCAALLLGRMRRVGGNAARNWQ